MNQPDLENKENQSRSTKILEPRRSFGTDLTNISYTDITAKLQNNTSYTKDTANLFHGIESRLLPLYGYMKHQTDISEKMRAMLVDWLIEVHNRFSLSPETLSLTVNLIDRFLEKEKILRNRLQLVGVTSLFIASKYEEQYPPLVKDFSYITDSAFDEDDIISMEKLMLQTLDYNLTTPSVIKFLDLYQENLDLERRNVCLMLYLIELSYLEYKMIKHKPSITAAAAIYLSKKILGNLPE